MKFVFICTEGESSEPSGISAIVSNFRSQVPEAYKTLEVLPIPLGGNHGYKNLVSLCIEQVRAKMDEFEYDAIFDECYKFIVCDYDNIDASGIDLQELRDSAETVGFKLLITRPKFEYFVARHFFSEDELLSVNSAALNGKIQQGIEKYNAKKPTYLHIPSYGKNKTASKNCLGALYNFDPSFIDIACSIEANINSGQYTELPELIKFLRDLFQN